MKILVLALLVGVPMHAQTLYTIEGAGPTYGQFVGVGACGTPSGPFLDVTFAPQLLPPCPMLTGFAPHPGGTLGDVAVDHVGDRVWATDGLHMARYTPDGVIDMQFILPTGLAVSGPVTGLGFDATTGHLWVTDGDEAAEVGTGLSCTSPVVFASFPLFGVFGVAQDIEYDACSDTVWVVTSLGHLGHYTLAGAEISDVDITPGPCGLGDDLSGLGFDTTDGSFYVTDGFVVAHVTGAGAAAAANFTFPDPCEVVFPGGPPVPISGLAFSLRPARYGAGSEPVDGGATPRLTLAWEIGMDPEESVMPNPTFQIGLADADVGGDAALVIGLSAPCTPPAFKGCALWVTPPFTLVLGPFAVPFGGAIDLGLVLPFVACGAAEIGITLHAQWLVDQPGAGWESSEGVAFTLGKP